MCVLSTRPPDRVYLIMVNNFGCERMRENTVTDVYITHFYTRSYYVILRSQSPIFQISNEIHKWMTLKFTFYSLCLASSLIVISNTCTNTIDIAGGLCRRVCKWLRAHTQTKDTERDAYIRQIHTPVAKFLTHKFYLWAHKKCRCWAICNAVREREEVNTNTNITKIRHIYERNNPVKRLAIEQIQFFFVYL